MSSERDLVAELAAEIRAAVAERATAPREQGPSNAESEEAEKIRLPLSRAEAHLTPSVPSGVRLSRSKRVVLRALRFLWRDQAAFNALILDALREHLDQAAAERRRIGLLLRKVEESATGLEERGRRLDRFRADTERAVERWERRAAIQDARLVMLEAGDVRSARAQASEISRDSPLPAGVYSLFEERFRGSPEEIEAKQRSYLAELRGLPGPVFDLGCGRGEFLRLLRTEGIPAAGAEMNPVAVSLCRADGLEVTEEEGLSALGRYSPGSLGGVVAFQVVEHWTPEKTFRFLREARRALASGGVLIVETINTDSLSTLKAFYLDPSHVRPVPPDALKFLAEAAGFAEVRVLYRADLSAAERLEEDSENARKLNRLLFGPQDYAVVGRVLRA